MKAPPFKPPPFRVDFSDVILAMTVLKGLNDVEIKKHVLSIKDVHRQTTMDIVGLIEAQEQGRDGAFPAVRPTAAPQLVAGATARPGNPPPTYQSPQQHYVGSPAGAGGRRVGRAHVRPSG